MKPSSPFQIYKEFFFALAAVFMIGTLQGLADETLLWPFAFMIFMVIVYSGKYGRVDLTMTNTLARFFIEQDESLLMVDMLYTLLAQFLGGLLGSIIYVVVVDAPTMIMVSAPSSDERWRPLLCFAFFHGIYYQALAAYKKIGTGERQALLAPKKSEPEDSSLERNLGMAFAYASVAVAFQAFTPGAMGGINLDLCRQLGSKMLKSDEAGTNMKDTWWILMFGPIIGVLQAKLFVIIEAYLESGAGGKADGGNAKTSNAESAVAAVEIQDQKAADEVDV